MNQALTAPSLNIPADAIRMTSRFFQSMRGVESCCFWLGPRSADGTGTVMSIVVPRQRNNPGNYHIEAEAMIEVANIARPRGWTNLAQVHSHPGGDVRHSGYDDEMANSRRALSLIYPSYGHSPGMWRFRGWLWSLWPGVFPKSVGVHAFKNSRWTFLDDGRRAEAISIVPGPAPKLIDLRK